MNETSKVNPLMLLLALGGLWLAFGDSAKVQDWFELQVHGKQEPAEPEPSELLKGKVLPIREALHDQPQKAAALASYFAGVAACVADDAGQSLPTVVEFQRAFKNGLIITCKSKGWPADIGDHVDELIGSYLELTREGNAWLPAPLDESRRHRLIDLLKALAWACGGAA